MQVIGYIGVHKTVLIGALFMNYLDFTQLVGSFPLKFPKNSLTAKFGIQLQGGKTKVKKQLTFARELVPSSDRVCEFTHAWRFQKKIKSVLGAGSMSETKKQTKNNKTPQLIMKLKFPHSLIQYLAVEDSFTQQTCLSLYLMP